MAHCLLALFCIFFSLAISFFSLSRLWFESLQQPTSASVCFYNPSLFLENCQRPLFHEWSTTAKDSNKKKDTPEKDRREIEEAE
jgi:hypothetical protein